MRKGSSARRGSSRPRRQNQAAIEADLTAFAPSRARPAPRRGDPPSRAADPELRPVHLVRDPLPRPHRGGRVMTARWTILVCGDAAAATTAPGSRSPTGWRGRVAQTQDSPRRPAPGRGPHRRARPRPVHRRRCRPWRRAGAGRRAAARSARIRLLRSRSGLDPRAPGRRDGPAGGSARRERRAGHVRRGRRQRVRAGVRAERRRPRGIEPAAAAIERRLVAPRGAARCA